METEIAKEAEQPACSPSCPFKLQLQDAARDFRKSQSEWVKEKAILEQKIELQKMQIDEFAEREQMQK